MDMTNNPQIVEDKWIYSACHRCLSDCGIRVRRVNGVAVKIEGLPESSVGSRGGLCPRGMAGLQILYDPNRINYPLKRTNPNKGIGEDPKWERISWDDAYDMIGERLSAIKADDPGRMIIQNGIVSGNQNVPYFFVPLMVSMQTEKGKPGYINAAGAHCGNAGHFINSNNYASFVVMPDWKYCEYVMIFGTNTANGGFQQFASKLAAEARVRGMKVVVFDPMKNTAATKATEWIPTIPGTDGILCLAMLNVIVNELDIYDKEHLKYKTNAPYLVDNTGKYVRNKATGKPLVWDAVSGCAKNFDDKSIGDYALFGEYDVDGVNCRPCWETMCERFAEYTCEEAEKWSNVPAETIRRIATEYAHAARIGQKIIIDGHELPIRPVATFNIRAAGTHKNGMHTLFAMDLLNHVMGAVSVPGGTVTVSVECHGHPDTGQPYLAVGACKDGFLKTAGRWLFPQGGFWPLPEPEYPTHSLGQLFPMVLAMPLLNTSNREEVMLKAGLRTEFDMLINHGCNAIMNGCNPKDRERFYKKCGFIVDIDIYPTEFSEGFADILLPDACYLERSDWMGIQHSYHNIPPGLDEPWCFHVSQRVVDPLHERKSAAHIIIDIAEKIGATPAINTYYNEMLSLDESRKVPVDKKIDWDSLCDRACRQFFGEKYNWDYFVENGFATWPKKVEEVYWGCFKDIRTQVYWEFMIDTGRKASELAKQAGIAEYFDWSVYEARPLWYSLEIHEVDKEEFPFYGFTWSEPYHGNAMTQQQPWIDEISQADPFTYYVNINEDTAERLGLKAGDKVEIETWRGLKTEGVLQTRQGIHPEAMGVMGVSGHWAEGQPIAKGKGVNFNSLIDTKVEDLDPICGTVDICVKCKLTRIGN